MWIEAWTAANFCRVFSSLKFAIALHRSLQKLQRSLTVPPFRHENLKCLTFLIHGAPEVADLAIDPHKNFVHVPAPQ